MESQIFKRYILTSTVFEGYLSFAFNKYGLLLTLDFSESKMTEKQMNWFNQKLPKNFAELEAILKSSKHGATLVEQPDVQPTFEMFWNSYDEKLRSSKKKALKVWDKLNANNQFMAHNFIKKYNRIIPDGVAKKYAETYLNAELWNN